MFINQIRQKIGVMFGNPETTSGGMALRFYASVRLEIRKITGVKDGEEVVGSRVRVKVVKNKVAPPFRQAEFDLMYDRGINWEDDLLELAVEGKLVEKSGAWFVIGGDRMQGREKVKEYFREHPEVVEKLKAEVLLKNARPELDVPVAADEEEAAEETPAPTPTPTAADGNRPLLRRQRPRRNDLSFSPKGAAENSEGRKPWSPGVGLVHRPGFRPTNQG